MVQDRVNTCYIWKLGDSDFTDVGKLLGENQKAEIGVVNSPQGIITRMRTGKYHARYPTYE